ncbi:MAG: MATE family efflux transporter [Bacteroidales bacterium]
MYKFNTYREHYIRNAKLAAPVVLSQVGQSIVQLIDIAMIGSLGAIPLAAASFAGSVFFLLFLVGMGFSMGITPLVGESYSQKRHKDSANYLQNAILLYLSVGVIIYLAQQLTIPLLYKMGQTPEVIDQAIPYYQMLILSVVPFMLFSCFKQFLEGIGNTKVTMMVIIITNIVNVIGNYLLIYGKFGFPAMGVEGAGLSTLISRILMPILLISYFYYLPNFRRYFKLFSWSRVKAKTLRSLTAVGIPIGSQIFMEACAFSLSTIMAGWLGASEQGANHIALTISNFAFMAVIGVASATTIRVSHEYGVRNLKEMNRAANASVHICLLWSIFTATTFLVLRNILPLAFTNDADIIRITTTLLIFVSMYQFSDGLQCVAIGILRGMKDVKSIMIIAFISYVVVSLPVAYTFAFIVGLGVNGIWIGLITGLSLASILLFSRYFHLYRKLINKNNCI